MSNKKTSDITSNDPTFMDKSAMMLWKACNFTTTVFLTSGVITLGHSPLNSLMVSMANGKTIPASPNAYLKFPILIRNLYAGSVPYLLGTSSRTIVMTGAKKIEPSANHSIDEPAHNPQISFADKNHANTLFVKLAVITAFSLSDYLVGQLPEALSLIQKAGIQVNWKTPHNLTKLYITGGVSRFCFSSIYIGALCEAEKALAPHMPFSNHTINHVTAGILSGAGAAYASYPFSRVRDDRIAKLSVIEGKLTGPTLSQYTNQILKYIRSTPTKEIIKDTINDFFIQGNLRAIRGAYRFAAIVFMAELCGNEPLGVFFKNDNTTNNHSRGFFSKSSTETQNHDSENTSDNGKNKP